MSRILDRLLDPAPHRTLAQLFLRHVPIAPYAWRIELGAVDRPAYGYGLFHAAGLARRLGYARISALEFGVAGGNGLVALERHAARAARHWDIVIDVYGFDTGAGLPAPVDYRDLPYHWAEGFYRMDVPALRARLKAAKLVLGDVRETVEAFVAEQAPAPIGFVAYDLDFHSSTAAALGLLDAGAKWHLPRVYTYFDDIVGGEVELYNAFTGQRLAIEEFNTAHARAKLAPLHHLLARRAVEPWHHQLRIAHFFDHPRYNTFVSDDDQQLRLG